MLRHPVSRPRRSVLFALQTIISASLLMVAHGTPAKDEPMVLPALPTPDHIRREVGLGYQSQVPMSPDEIRWVREQMEQSQYAMHSAAPRETLTRTLAVETGPGSPTPALVLAPGYVTTVSVVDREGNPWPVSTVDVGADGQFTVSSPATEARAATRPADNEGAAEPSASSQVVPENLILLRSRYFGATTNVVITLKGLDTPVILDVKSASPDARQIDGRATLRLDRLSPAAVLPVIAAPPPSPMNPVLLGFLQQVPPSDAVPVNLEGMPSGEVVAWEWDESLIIRSLHPLLSPAWTAQVKQGGVHVYRVDKTPVLLVRAGERTVPVSVSAASRFEMGSGE